MIAWDAHVLAPLIGVFGEAIVFTPAGGDAVAALGVFDEAYSTVELVGDMGVQSERPVLGVHLSSWPVPPMQGDSITLCRLNAHYRILEVRPDGHGWAKLILNEGM